MFLRTTPTSLVRLYPVTAIPVRKPLDAEDVVGLPSVLNK